MLISKSNFLIVGIAKSGLSATKQLLLRGGKCMVYDDSNSDFISKSIQELLMLGAVDARTDIDSAINWCDIVVISPGVPIDHKIPLTAKRLRKRVIGELELGSLLIKSPIIAVTGTNGKTTTCSMLTEILNKAGEKAISVGNIGSPICENVDNLTENTYAVTEVSSFQLESVHSFCPHIAVVLNITPDHLSRHYNMDNYVYLKKRILTNMRESEFCVLNYDDEKVREFSKTARCKVVFFSLKEKISGCYVVDGNIYYMGEFIMPTSEIALSGAHNLENVLASICVSKILDIDTSAICDAVENFNGVKHRIELVKEIDGIKFYNDSKATNPDATIKAINSMTVPTVVILGGKDKGLSFDELFKKISSSCITHAVLTGENRYSLLDSSKRSGFDSVTVTGDFESAVKIAEMECEKGGAVLLSPASSSFDMFSGFEARGEAFIKIVLSLDE